MKTQVEHASLGGLSKASVPAASVHAANPWPRRVFLLILALIVAPVLLIGVGLVVPYFAARSNQPPTALQVPEPPKLVAIVTPARAPFIGELSQGSIELVAISEHPSDGKSWWRMNGEPALEGPFINRGQSITPKPDQHAFEFVFRTKGLPPDASSLFWEITGQSSGGMRPTLAAQPNTALADYNLITASFPAEIDGTEIRAGIALGTWEPIFGHLPGNSAVRSATYDNGAKFTLTLDSAGESEGGETMVTYSHSPKPGWVQRLVAVTKDDKEIAPSFFATVGEQNEVRFANLPIKSVAHFKFQVRRIQWVEFRRVPLQPAPAKP